MAFTHHCAESSRSIGPADTSAADRVIVCKGLYLSVPDMMDIIGIDASTNVTVTWAIAVEILDAVRNDPTDSSRNTFRNGLLDTVTDMRNVPTPMEEDSSARTGRVN